MEELKKYTDEELKLELKRRAVERRANTKKEIQYVEFDGTISHVDNINEYYVGGTVRYKPLVFWKYKIKDSNSILSQQNSSILYYMKQGTFKRENAPKVGDRVKLRYRRTKKKDEYFDFSKAKIIGIIKSEN